MSVTFRVSATPRHEYDVTSINLANGNARIVLLAARLPCDDDDDLAGEMTPEQAEYAARTLREYTYDHTRPATDSGAYTGHARMIDFGCPPAQLLRYADSLDVLASHNLPIYYS